MACADKDSLDAVSIVQDIMSSELSGTMSLLGYDEVYPCSSFVEVLHGVRIWLIQQGGHQ